jgi:Flp pilus assembly protein TadG
MRLGFLFQWKRLARDRGGATAVEFALVAIPFFWLVFAIIEIAGVSMAQTSLDAAVSETARTIRTGEAQAGAVTETAFKTAVCDYINRMMSLDCVNNLNIDVRRFVDFDGVASPSPLVGGAIDPALLEFQPGGASEVVLVRAFYEWNIMTPVFGEFLANVGPGRRIINTSALFRNEPF